MSVLEYQGAAAATAVIMSHEMRSKKILFVEGIHDGRLFKALFDSTFISISAKGMNGVICALDVIAEYNQQSNDAIDALGFIDKDYLHLIDETGVLDREDVITTENRDIEIDLFHTEGIKRLLEEKASAGKWTCEKELINQILDSLEALSFLRAYNALASKSWDFKEIDLCKYVDTLGRLNQAKLTSAFRQKNHIKNNEWDDFNEWKNEANLYLSTITRGHDAACVFGQMLRKMLGNRKKEESSLEVVEENLRLSIEAKFVEAFNWFTRISEWSHNNQLQATA